MKQKQKNKFWSFIFSFMPGATEMYMGFMKNGLSIMGIFFLYIFAMMMLRLHDYFSVFIAIIWFYSFFHARNYASCTEEEFATLKDIWVWDEFTAEQVIRTDSKKMRTIGAVILILLGIGILWSYFSRIIFLLIPNLSWNVYADQISKIPSLIFAVLIIVGGVKLIKGKKEELDGELKSDRTEKSEESKN